MSDVANFAAPVIVGTPLRERLSSDRRFADAYFLREYRRLRHIYRKTGSPSLSYLYGNPMADFGSTVLHLSGSFGLGLLHMKLGELQIAGAASAADLHRAERHLLAGRDQIERSPYHDLIAFALGHWYMLMSVTYKARGDVSGYEEFLYRGVSDTWLREHGSPGDHVPVLRQEAMMKQDLNRHLALIFKARTYQHERPMEYYRTLKRGTEFLANLGMVSSAAAIKQEFIAAFGRVYQASPLIGRVSFLKNLAQMLALEGDVSEAARAARAALTDARGADLKGQVRQLEVLLDAIRQGDVKGALESFRV